MVRGEEHLLIKVSSKPVFNFLVNPDESFFAIQTLEAYKKLSALQEVLIAVWRAPAGLVVIMRDLEPLGYTDLRPESTRASTSDLWKHFMKLARSQLIPLAHANVIHPDIRVGYDYTANIMAKQDGRDMVLVDFESLVKVSGYNFPHGDKHSRYLPETTNAFAFVCLQCYAVAVFWSERRNQLVGDEEMPADSVVDDLVGVLESKSVVGEADVERLLDEIDSQLENSGRLNRTELRLNRTELERLLL